MDKLKYSDVKDMDVKSIEEKVLQIRRNIFTKKIESTTSGMNKPHELKIMKKNIARLLTSRSAKSTSK